MLAQENGQAPVPADGVQPVQDVMTESGAVPAGWNGMDAPGSGAQDFLEAAAEGAGGMDAAPECACAAAAISPAPDAPQDGGNAAGQNAPAVLPETDGFPQSRRGAEAFMGFSPADLEEQIRWTLLDGNDPSQLESDLWLAAGGSADVFSRIAEMHAQEAESEPFRRDLSMALGAAGACSRAAAAAWRRIEAEAPRFRREALETVRMRIGFELDRLAERGDEAGAAKLRSAAARLYGGEAVPAAAERCGASAHPHLDGVFAAGTQHSLGTRVPSQEWNVYIDESGVKFSDSSGGAEGLVVAVCVRHGAKLPALNGFHCSAAGPEAAIVQMNRLLRSACGILGFTRRSLGTAGQTGWFPCICELMKWVWRMLPLQKNGVPVGLRFHVEQRGSFSSEMATEFGLKMLESELRRENPDRAQRIRILSFQFEDKQSPMLAWADVVSFLWSRYENGMLPSFPQTGLLGSCLVSCQSVLLDSCARVFGAGVPDGDAWLRLLMEKTPVGSPMMQALDLLREKCAGFPEARALYAARLQSALRGGMGGMNGMSVLERGARWLGGACRGFPAAEFLYACADVRKAGAGGSRFPEAEAAMARLVPEVEALNPRTALYAADLLADADLRWFNASQAAGRFARWDASAGGALPRDAEDAAFALSRLGRCRALQGCTREAVRLFGEELAVYDGLGIPESDPRRRLALMQRTACILALHPSEAEARAAMAALLGTEDAASVCRSFAENPLLDPPKQWLCAKFAFFYGTEEERSAYCAMRWRWIEQGCGAPKNWTSQFSWPRVQYCRWLLAGDADAMLRRTLKAQMADCIAGIDEGKMYGSGALAHLCIALSMGAVSAASPDVRRRLLRLGNEMPEASGIVRQALAAPHGDALLAMRALPAVMC